MQNLPSFLKIFRNKYVVAILVFVVWILFFDRNDLLTQWDREKELEKLEISKAYYQTEINSIKKDLADLQNNPNILEKYAREKFYLKRPNEDVFIIEDSTQKKNISPLQ